MPGQREDRRNASNRTCFQSCKCRHASASIYKHNKSRSKIIPKSIPINILEPVLNVVKARRVGYVINNENAISSLIIRAGNSLESSGRLYPKAAGEPAMIVQMVLI